MMALSIWLNPMAKCGKGYISAGKRCLKQGEGGGITYAGRNFPGFNKPVKSWRPGKKRAVLAKKGDKVKVVHYGATGYKNNYSAEAKKSYLARSAGIKNKSGQSTANDVFSPNHWARKDLWSKRLPPDGSNKYKVDSMDGKCGCSDCKKKGLTKSQCACGGQDEAPNYKKPLAKTKRVDSTKPLEYQAAYLEVKRQYARSR